MRLQHPLGVASNKANGKLYLVDSYNHKVISVLEALELMYFGSTTITRWGDRKYVYDKQF